MYGMTGVRDDVPAPVREFMRDFANLIGCGFQVFGPIQRGSERSASHAPRRDY